ncbi:MAG: hypothetical protein DVB28_001351 [Verrucomicrobia bacterium]|nr:MAG: hypothetical protein DVB28_001351 [Verrucomicrobiota bacterium]
MLNPHRPSFSPPSGYFRVKVVQSFEELVSSPFEDGVNAICWERNLLGDFAEVVRGLAVEEGIVTLDETRLRGLSLSAAGRAAADAMLEDLRLLTDLGLSPTLDCIHSYPRDEEPAAVRTDVYSFHADSATAAADTYLCSYNGPASEGLRNEEAQRRVDIPETRAMLLQAFGGKDDEDFLGYLAENCFDLHYAPAPGALPFSFGLGNLWRIAVEYPDSPVPPCIHRAPETLPGQPPRLLLIS